MKKTTQKEKEMFKEGYKKGYDDALLDMREAINRELGNKKFRGAE